MNGETRLARHRPWGGNDTPGRGELREEDRQQEPLWFLWLKSTQIALLVGVPSAALLCWAGMVWSQEWIGLSGVVWGWVGFAVGWAALFLGGSWLLEYRRLSRFLTTEAWRTVEKTLTRHPQWRRVVASWRSPPDELRVRDARALFQAAIYEDHPPNPPPADSEKPRGNRWAAAVTGLPVFLMRAATKTWRTVRKTATWEINRETLKEFWSELTMWGLLLSVFFLSPALAPLFCAIALVEEWAVNHEAADPEVDRIRQRCQLRELQLAHCLETELPPPSATPNRRRRI